MDASTFRVYANEMSSYVPGTYVACIYDVQWLLLNILSISEENQDLHIKIMKKCKLGFFKQHIKNQKKENNFLVRLSILNSKIARKSF